MKYQRKLKREIAKLYQSNDPMHWVYLSMRFGNTNRLMTNRERRIFMRRLTKTFKPVADMIKRAFEELPKMVTKVADSVAKMVEALNNNPQMNTPLLKTHISIDHIPADAPVRQSLIGRVAVQPMTLPRMAIGTIHVDEAMNLDDETMRKLQQTVDNPVELGKNDGSIDN